MKRIVVVGCAGSGKSFFARKLAEVTGLPLYHLDLIWWREDGTNIERSEFDEMLGKILEKDEWIIDGNYQRTMEMRIQAADTVFFLDFATDVCLDGIKSRKGKPRQDMAWQTPLEDEDHEFVEFVKKYNTDNRPRVLELLSGYSDKNIIIFKTRKEIGDFLREV